MHEKAKLVLEDLTFPNQPVPESLADAQCQKQHSESKLRWRTSRFESARAPCQCPSPCKSSAVTKASQRDGELIGATPRLRTPGSLRRCPAGSASVKKWHMWQAPKIHGSLHPPASLFETSKLRDSSISGTSKGPVLLDLAPILEPRPRPLCWFVGHAGLCGTCSAGILTLSFACWFQTCRMRAEE